MNKMWSPSIALTILAVFLCANLLICVKSKSFFSIGTRIIGDQLLLKDVLQTPPSSLKEELAIKFKYVIAEPITYLEIESDKNASAKINFSYQLDLIEGTISSIKYQNDGATNRPEFFEVLLRIYGFNESMLNVIPFYILNKDQKFNGVLQPIYQGKINKSLGLTEEEFTSLDDSNIDYDDDDDGDGDSDNTIDDNDDNDATNDEEAIDYEEDDFNNNFDKIVEQGQRQEGDFLVYETNQTSATTTELPTNHSVTFYYIDIYYITYVRFTIYEHYLYHPLNNYDNTYVVEYAQISPMTLKAIVTDHRTTSLFVQMQMYGFYPTALPVDYKPFLSNSQTASTTTRPISSLTQLKILMNSQQSTTKQQQKDKDLSEQLTLKFDQEIFNDNKIKDNCIQQVLPSLANAENKCQRFFSYSSIFKSIALWFVAIMIFV